MKQIDEISLTDFDTDISAFKKVDLLVAVKSFDLQSIRKRYLDSRQRSKTGSVSRRAPSIGGLVLLSIERGIIMHQSIIAKLREPRGIDIIDRQISISSENRIYVFNKNSNLPMTIDHPWLSYIHTVRFNNKGDRILVSSSGLDIILEFELENGECIWEWLAWENGFDTGFDPVNNVEFRLTRSKQKAKIFIENGIDYNLITNPQNDHLPTAMRTAFINTAEYDSNGDILATLFHSGSVIRINKNNLSWINIIKGLSKPHGCSTYSNTYIVTDTAHGQIIIFDSKKQIQLSFRKEPGKPDSMEDLEWLQTSCVSDKTIITVDSNRSQLTFLDIKEQKKMHITYNPEWAIQDIVILDQNSISLLPVIRQHF
ncbi:MAG: hypothetical protein HQ541_01530 [Mariniphaga sp.]|nr:hypothetical protein [Mariniphaga sp.]